MDSSALLDWVTQHRQTLAWLAGGVATATGALWVVVRYFLDRSASKTTSKPAAPSVSATGGLAAGRDLQVGRDVTLNQDRIPRGAIGLAALGLLLLGYAIFNSGSHITAQNSNVNTGTQTNSHQEVNPSGPAGGPSR
jgi:ammonia channel protein AmtB